MGKAGIGVEEEVVAESDGGGGSVEERADAIVQKEKVRGKKNWRSYIWDTLDKSPEERKFLFKLDAALLTFASLGKYGKGADAELPSFFLWSLL